MATKRVQALMIAPKRKPANMLLETAKGGVRFMKRHKATHMKMPHIIPKLKPNTAASFKGET